MTGGGNNLGGKYQGEMTWGNVRGGGGMTRGICPGMESARCSRSGNHSQFGHL